MKVPDRPGRQAAILMLLITCMAVTLPGCGSNKTSDRDIEFITALDVDELSRSRSGILGIGSREGAILIDPRTEAAFEAGHIPGARSYPFQNIARDYQPLLEFKSIIVYGDTYNDPKAKAMSKRLMNLGCKNVKTLRGGLEEWNANGFELATGKEVAPAPKK